MTTVLQGLTNFIAAEKERGIVPDLLARWHAGMETQVLVSSVGGWPAEEKPGCFTNGKESWWHIRVPKHADSEPEFNDYPLNWFLHEHADCIGSTGWDWQNRTSRWVGFDFDALVGHAKGVGVEDEELNAVKEKAQALPYVEVRRSTGGAGLHLYVHVDIPTENHTVHSALARAILSMMSAATGFDFASRIDCCGGNMWIWRKDLEPGGLGLAPIKMASHYLTESDLPSNWRDHISVVKKGRGKLATEESVAALSNAIKEVPLDEEHKALMAALGETGFTTLWNNDYHCLHTKTKALQNIYESQVVPVKGVFRTLSEGNNPSEPNCYMFPTEGGGWRVYRFGAAKEADTWSEDGSGRSNCYFNKRATLKTAALYYGGDEDPDTGEFVFDNVQAAIDTASCLGDVLILPEQATGRLVRLGKSKDGRLVAKIQKETKEKGSITGWIDKGKAYVKVLKSLIADTEESYSEYDNVFRKLISVDGKDAGWVYRSEDEWIEGGKDDIKNRLESLDVPKGEINPLLGKALFQPWRLVNLPFQEEYPGGRQWNLGAAQLAYEPATDNAPHPTWDLILKHCGADLDDYVKELPWCQEDRVFSGADYLKAWIACLFRCPFEPLPFLFFFGKQNHGKSIFHEATDLLMTKGVVRANRALTTKSDFNGELATAILCTVEEVDLSASGVASDRVKDWTTSPTIAIRQMRTDQFQIPNTTHWVQCANHRSYCPIFPGDSRIVAMFVRKPEVDIPKEELKQKLRDEAPHFLATLMNMELPKRRGRLRLPVIETANKQAAAQLNSNPVEEFAAKNIVPEPGSRIALAEFNQRLRQAVSEDGRDTMKRDLKSKEIASATSISVHRYDKGWFLENVRWADFYATSA